MKTHIRFLMFALFFFNDGCHAIEFESPTKNECAALVDSFFQLTHKEQVTQFSNFDLNRQYVTYICGMREIHPQTLYLADEFAKEGKVAFPYLAKKLSETRNDSSFRDIVYVISEMQRR